jgi:hypothetical protein
MPRFFIHFRNTALLAKDDVGIDLPGLAEAKAAALASPRQVLADNVKFNSPHPLVEVIIASESGEQLATIPVEDILPEALKAD